MDQAELVGLLKDMLLPHTPATNQPRKLVLVGHEFSFEIQVLRGLGINLALAPMVENILDTHFLGIEVLGQDFGLGCLTRQLRMPGSHFHNAGNDANFSLRSMLLLATHNLSTIGGSQQARLESYEKVARI